MGVEVSWWWRGGLGWYGWGEGKGWGVHGGGGGVKWGTGCWKRARSGKGGGEVEWGWREGG